MPVTRAMLLAELKELQRLTAFEQAIATVRRTQAASNDIAQELAANATMSGERLTQLAQAVRRAGGTPDVVGPVLGKLGALLQTQVNQVQTLQGALLGDLALEHQLRERARYARTLAVTLGEMSVLPVLDRLDGAHTETIAWLERRLGEVARTGSSALQATPLQAAIGSVRQAAGLPFSLAADGVNQVGALLARWTRSAPAVVEQAADVVRDTVTEAAAPVAQAATQAASQASQAASQAVDTVSEGVSAAADTVRAAADTVDSTVDNTVETAVDFATAPAAPGTTPIAPDGAEALDLASAPAAATAEQVTHEVLEASGGDDVPDAKPPFAGYERLSGDSIMRHVDDTEDVDELRTLLAFEQAHKVRKGVLKTVQDRLTVLAGA